MSRVLYITGLPALNLACKLDTSGDWHTSNYNYNKVEFKNSEDSHFNDWGIEQNRKLPYVEGKYNVANHIRACLDMMLEQDFSNLQGMRRDYMCTEQYNELIFSKVAELKNMDIWDRIDSFMEKEYMNKWLNFKRRCF